MIEASPYPIYICDEKNLFFVNPAFEQMYEYSAKELTTEGFVFLNLVAPEYRDLVKNFLNELGKKIGRSDDLSFTGITKSGRRIFLHTTVNVIDNGKICFHGITRDITKDIISEETLFNSRQMLRFVYDNVPQRIYLKDKNCVYFSANRQFLKDAGFEREEQAIGLTDSDLPWKNYAAELWVEDQWVLSGNTYHIESQEYIINGKLSIRKKIKFPLRNKNGEIVGILGTYEDITEISQYNQSLFNSEAKYRSIFNNSHTPMLIIDPESGNIMEANIAASYFYGYMQEELAGMNITDLNTLPRKDIQNYFDKAKGNTQNIFFLKHRKKSGKMADIEVHSGPIIIDGKKCLIEFLYDITEKTMMIEELKIAKKDAEEMNRLKSVFLANMSHELRTPLVGILGYSRLIKEDSHEEDIIKMADNVERGGNRLLQTVNLILDLSRIEANRMEINFVKCNVSEAAYEVYCTFSSAAKLKNIELDFTSEMNPIFVNIDEMHLASILNNIVNNAIKFTNQGTVSISVGVDGNNAVFTISDTGIGIPEDKQSLVFNAFRQASEGISRSFDGTGLGLTLTKKFVLLMNGSIDMQSTPGKGTVFTITFPLYGEPEKVDENNKADFPVQISHTDKNILIVEDDIRNFEVTSIFLKKFYACTHAENGNQALDLIKKEHFDIILLDINIGNGPDGLEILSQLKNIPGYQKVPVIAVTAFTMKQNIEEFLKNGFHQVLTKPFNPNILLYTIQKYLNQ